MARTIDRASRVISGTWGSLWIDGDALVECTAFQLKFNKNKEKVYLCGQFATDTKAMSADGTGSITIKKVDSGQLQREMDMQKGVDRRYTLIGKLADPDAYGSERVAACNVSFDDLTLMDWKSNTIGEITLPFTFTRAELLDAIEVD